MFTCTYDPDYRISGGLYLPHSLSFIPFDTSKIYDCFACRLISDLLTNIQILYVSFTKVQRMFSYLWIDDCIVQAGGTEMDSYIL
jgi:hypothetical protein